MTQRRTTAMILWLAGAMTGCNAFADIDHGKPREGLACSIRADCTVAVPECQTAVACDNGQCVFENAIDGKVLPGQIGGDCVELQCDGTGRAKPVAAPLDIPDDDNPCTSDACDGPLPVHTLREWLPCYSGPDGTDGKGICTAGVQHCDAQGNPIGGCAGEVLPQPENCISPLDEDCDGEVNEEGDGCTCQPGEAVACYTGPAGTQDVGNCHAGMHYCKADGAGYEPCLGEQVPIAETCDAAMSDEDCDGQINEEGVDCVCGDGYVSEGEECDDANILSTDGCTASCKLAVCGDGFVQPIAGEACDDGNLDSNDSCNASCQLPACGDGYVQEAESCDDGNTSDGDSCPSTCLRPVSMLAIGNHHTCALLDDGRVKCWGANSLGQLGLGDAKNRGDEPGEMGEHLPAVDLGTGKTAVAIAAGFGHTCALLSDGHVKCWGMNQYGQLGLGDTQYRGDFPGEMGDALPAVDLGAGTTAVAIAAGSVHSCVITSDGRVKCWGSNGSGQLGLGDVNHRGGIPGEMGDNLPAVDLGAGKTAQAITAGGGSTCALLNDDTLKCWGYNGNGQLGLGDYFLRGDNPYEMGDNLPAVDVGTGRTAVAASASGLHMCVLLSDNSIKCWGQNDAGQLGLGHTFHRGDGPNEMGDNLPAVDLGTGKTAVAVTAGFKHSCAILNDDTLKCWGSGFYGALGLGDLVTRGNDLNEMGDNLPAVDLGAGLVPFAVSLGFYSSCVLLSQGRVKCWGKNDYGQLGLGDTGNRGDGPNEMGDQLPFVVP